MINQLYKKQTVIFGKMLLLCNCKLENGFHEKVVTDVTHSVKFTLLFFLEKLWLESMNNRE